MSDRLQIEKQIRQLLSEATSAVALSNKLLAPGGLFSQMASNEQERRAQIESPLYREAKRRIAELRKTEAREFSETVRRYEEAKGQQISIKIEQTPSS